MKPKSHYIIDPELDTLFIAKEAREQQLKRQEVVNATLGSFYDQDKQFFHFNAVEKAMLEIDRTYPYTPTEGLEGVAKRWFDRLSQKPLTIPHDHVLTLGGSGALYLAYDSYLSKGDAVITSIPTWNNHYAMLKHLDITFQTFKGYHDGYFDIDLLKYTLDQSLLHHHKVMVLINDPAHNPTGYSLSQNEWKRILNLLNQYDTQRVSLLIDMAYLDFATLDFNLFQILETYQDRLTVLCAISGSKSYSLYGARIGMLLCMAHDRHIVDHFKVAVIFSARATYSLPPSFPAKVIDALHTKSLHEYVEELNGLKSILKERSQKLINLFDTFQIPYFPYHHGFFITLMHKNPHALFKSFKTLGIYTIPVEDGIRFAVSALNDEDIMSIKKAIETVSQEIK